MVGDMVPATNSPGETHGQALGEQLRDTFRRSGARWDCMARRRWRRGRWAAHRRRGRPQQAPLRARSPGCAARPRWRPPQAALAGTGSIGATKLTTRCGASRWSTCTTTRRPGPERWSGGSALRWPVTQNLVSPLVARITHGCLRGSRNDARKFRVEIDFAACYCPPGEV
jgi:hypothetical protein